MTKKKNLKEASPAPIPWKTYGGREYIYLIGANEAILGALPAGFTAEPPNIPHPENAANAAFIVKAVNLHEELMGALKKAQEFIQEEYCNRKAGGEEGYIGEAEEALKHLRAVLSAADDL